MDMSDARHNINSLVMCCGSNVDYDEECQKAMIESWRMIQRALNRLQQYDDAGLANWLPTTETGDGE